MSDKDVIEVTNCFPITIKRKKDEIYLESELASNMYEISRRGNPNELIVGWFTTCATINSSTYDIHSQYSKLCDNLILLTMDLTLKNNKLDCKAYTNLNMGVADKMYGSMFLPIPLVIVTYPCERIAIDTIIRDQNRLLNKLQANQTSPATNLTAISSTSTGAAEPSGKENRGTLTKLPDNTSFQINPSDISRLTLTMDEIAQKLSIVKKYVDTILSTPANTLNSNACDALEATQIGHTLKELLACFPFASLGKTECEEMFKGNIKDMLMIAYVMKLLQCQVNIQAKLNVL